MLPEFLRRLDPDVYHSSRYVVLDFEVDAAHGDFGRAIFPDNKLLLACWRTPEGVVKTCWGNELEQQELFADIEECDFIVAHNSIYELGWLKRGGADISRLLPFDTKLAEYVLLGNRASGHADSGMVPVSTSLDSCCARRAMARKDPVVDLLLQDGISAVAIPRKWLEDRCKQDVETTHELFKSQLVELSASGRLPVLFTRCLLTPVLASIQSEGMQLDAERVDKEYQEHTAKLAELEVKVKEMTGGINTASSKQLGEYLYDTLKFAEKTDGRGNPKRTASGKRSTNIKILDTLKAESPEQKAFLALHKEQSKIQAALSKSLEFMKGVCDEEGGHFYADLNQTRTATHRLASSGIPSAHGSVQFQNFPKAFKRLFKATREGWFIGETDGSQLEFRVAGFLGQDEQIMLDLQDPDFDAHITSGSAMEGTEYYKLLERYRSGDKKAKKIRDEAKKDTFKPLYGGKSGDKKQKRWYEEFGKRYHGLVDTQKGWVAEVLRTKKLVLPWGMTFYFPNARMSSSGYVNVGNSVYNYPIQSLATAEIIPIAIVFLWHEIQARGLADKIKMVNTVHDSVVVEIDPTACAEYRQLAEECFTTRVYEYLETVYGIVFNVPLAADTVIGKFLGEEL